MKEEELKRLFCTPARCIHGQKGNGCRLGLWPTHPNCIFYEEAKRMEDPPQKEWVEGFGTIQVSEPTTICDIARTFSYITRETSALKEVEEFLGEFGYIDGTYDEDGGWTPPCPLRKRHSFGTFIPKEKATNKDARWVLSLNLLDASIEYRRCCPEVAGKLKGLHDKLERELKEEEK